MYKDFKQISTGDLLIANGDFVLSESDSMHIEDTIISHKGWWKEFPRDGVGISFYSKSSGQEQVLSRSIKLELEKDGFIVNNPVISFINDRLEINPNAERI